VMNMAPLSVTQRNTLYKYIEEIGDSLHMAGEPKPDALVELRKVDRAASKLCKYTDRLIRQLRKKTGP